jgi:phosphatidylserine decarboxylase
MIEVFGCGIGLALVVCLPLGWKWRMPVTVVLPASLVIGAVAGGIGTLISWQFPNLGFVPLIFIELALIGIFGCISIGLRFYRDPERVSPETENIILAPADGTVIYVHRVEKGSSLVSTKKGRQFELKEIMATDMLENAAFLVGIDMSLLDVHVNRAPMAGTIELVKHVGGRFISLRRPESEVTNERLTTIINNGRFSIGVIQIASRLVRRVVTYLAEGDTVGIGQRIGSITLGSQVDVAIPDVEGLSIDVAPGDKVSAGVSIIARYGS